MTSIEGLLSGHYARKDQGQERAVKVRQNGSRPSWRTLKSAVFQILLVGAINLALVAVPSRRLVIRETVFGVPDPNPLPYCQRILKTDIKTSIQELNTLEDYDLKKSLTELIDLDDWTERCNKCGYPKLIHKTIHRDATCTREPES